MSTPPPPRRSSRLIKRKSDILVAESSGVKARGKSVRGRSRTTASSSLDSSTMPRGRCGSGYYSSSSEDEDVKLTLLNQQQLRSARHKRPQLPFEEVPQPPLRLSADENHSLNTDRCRRVARYLRVILMARNAKEDNPLSAEEIHRAFVRLKVEGKDVIDEVMLHANIIPKYTLRFTIHKRWDANGESFFHYSFNI